MQGRFVFIDLILLCSNLAFGQNYILPQVTPKSPNVAGFDKYGDIPVSLGTWNHRCFYSFSSISVDGLTILSR